VKRLSGIFVVLVFSAMTVLLFPSQAAPSEDVESNISAALDFYKQGKNEEAIKALSAALMVLHNKRELVIKNIQLCDEIVGFGDYKKRASNKLKAGEPFMLYFEVEGYGVKRENNKYWFWLSEDAKLTNEKGEVMFQRDDFLSYNKSFKIPIFPFFMQNKIANLKPGKYKYEFTIKDHIKKAFVSSSIELEVEEAPTQTETGEQPLKK
jgi:hypothetical protein